jgi:hypothetical protein
VGLLLRKCKDCGQSPELKVEPLELTATAHFDDFAPIGMRLRLLDYRCPACGLEQAPPGEFDAGGRYGSGRSTDSGKALDAAVKSIGLSL